MVRLLWNAFLLWVMWTVLHMLPGRRIEQLKELAVCAAILVIIMIAYKKWQGLKVIW